MVCTLAKLQKEIGETKFDAHRIQNISHLTEEYLELVRNHHPKLLNKVKTHLLVHLQSDIERHGPPAAYCEDVFEKTHGSVRDRIFLSNQKNRSKDTASSFARLYVANHILSGGYYPDGDNWKQSSGEVLQIGSSKKVQKFLGTYVKKDDIINKVIKVQRNKHQKKIFTEADILLKQKCFTVGIDILHMDVKVAKATGVKLHDGTIINCDDGLEYEHADNQRYIGLLKNGLIIRARTDHFVAEVRRLQSTAERVAHCPKYVYSQSIDTVPVHRIRSRVHVLHNCTQECRIVHRQNKAIIKHNSDSFIINEYM